MKQFLVALSACLALASVMPTAVAAPERMPAFQTKVYENGEPLKNKPMVLRDFIELRHARGFSKAEYADLTGKKHSLNEWAGKLLMIDVWATWCEPCVRSLPAIKKLQERFNGKSDVQVISISMDRKAKQVTRFLKRHGFEGFETLIDPEQLLGDDVPIDVVPTVYMLDGSGNLVGFVRGFIDWTDEAAPGYIEALAEKYAKRDGDIVN